MLKIVSLLLQICFLALVVCKQLSVPELCRDQPSCFAFFLLARQQSGKSYKLFIHWLLAEPRRILINSCDVWSLQYLHAENSWLWLSFMSKEPLHFLSIYCCDDRRLLLVWLVGDLMKASDISNQWGTLCDSFDFESVCAHEWWLALRKYRKTCPTCHCWANYCLKDAGRRFLSIEIPQTSCYDACLDAYWSS